ncbi:uncharacterized protein ARMOST_18280 [Armillaria ostoyae]|uniref:Uncharacterized protein n=1 Tax=Armillaria ostoyae TaxID=47428 RepID=A0A284S1D8_ARMOS|nr:uncharacterized protein ARMOST_18280 [Armillaria ostoyae]
MSKCSTPMRTSNESSIRKEKTRCVPGSGMKRKMDDLLDLELPISSKRKMLEETEKKGEKGPAKRPRIDKSQFLWQPVREISHALLHPELQLTLGLVENYTLDLKAARRSLTNSPECPEFPEEQWLALLAGKAVNLDSVFATDHSTSINEVQTHEISEGIAIRFSENMSNQAESKRVISNADEWTTTWHMYTQAVLIAFPHRYQELALYQQYMSSLFRTTALPLHCRVFVLDRAIHNRVGRCRNILLSETDKLVE